MRPRGQASLETLLVISFVLLVGLGVGLPYLENQEFTNATAQTKIALLPVLENNRVPLRIITMQPNLAGSDFNILVTVRGKTTPELTSLLVTACAQICQAIDPNDHFTSETLTLINEDKVAYPNPYCNVSC